MELISLKFASLNIYYQNVGGMKTKTHSFYRNVCCSKFDIIIISETWLRDDYFDSELFSDDYTVYRRDRGTTVHRNRDDGGGVMIAVSNRYRSRPFVSDYNLTEDLWISIDLDAPSSTGIKQLVICAVYIRPPTTKITLDDFLKNCNMFFDKWDSPIFIVGDFNLRKITWSELYQTGKVTGITSLEQSLLNFINLNNLKQHNLIVNSYGKILDLVLSNASCTVNKSCEVLLNAHSFHPPLHIVLPLVGKEQLIYNDRPRFNFYNADYTSLNKYLANFDWEELFASCKDVNEMISNFYTFINETIRDFVPITKPKKKNFPFWFSRPLIRILAEKENVRRRFKKYRNPRDELELKCLSMRSERVARLNYNEYIRSLEANITRNCKYFWSYYKQKRGGKSNYPAAMSDGNTCSSDGEEICNMFASHFTSVYEDDTSIVHGNVQNLSTADIFANNHDSFTRIFINESEVIKFFKSLDKSKGAGPDGIPPVFISNCAETLAFPLTRIYNVSLSTGIFPTEWKMAKVVPIHKSGDAELVGNYRPISILSSFAKLLEALVCPYIQNYFKKYLSDHQHGFTKGRSTSTNLATFVEVIIGRVDSSAQVDVIYTDFSKAFDKVSHSVLVEKLTMYGFGGTMLQWLASYLRNRYFYVVVNGFASAIYNITSGVPQGSHLGPILFNVFINDLPGVFKFSTPFLYADDLKLVKVINSMTDCKLLQNDLNNLSIWCKSNGMFLNTGKCSFIKFTRRIHVFPAVYTLEGTVLAEMDCVRDLGVIFDKKLTFKPHIESTINKASRMLGFVLRNGKIFRSAKVKILLYNSLVRSVLEYCSVVWRPHYAVNSLHLERVQKRFLWHLSFSAGLSKKFKSYDKRLKHFKITPLSKRRELLDIVFLYKLIHNMVDCPQLLGNLNFRIPPKRPRFRIKPFHPPRRRTVLGSNSPVARMSGLYNDCSKHVDIFYDSLPGLKNSIVHFLNNR